MKTKKYKPPVSKFLLHTRSIKISDAVWEEMKKVGKFGETPDDVLRKKFKLERSLPTLKRMRMNGKRLTKVENDRLNEALDK